MTSKPRTFSKVIRKYILWCLTGMLLIYTVVLNFYLVNGTWMAATFELEIFGRQYERLLVLDENAALPSSFNITTYAQFNDIPTSIRDYIEKDEIEVGKLIDLDLEEIEEVDRNRADLFYMILPYQLKDGRLMFIVQSFHSDDEESAFIEKLDRYSLLTLPIAGGFLLFFIVVVAILGKRLAKPSQELAQWAQNLSSENLHKSVPDFRFDELNDVAKELHGSLLRNENFVVREREFLRQASHELRTPVTVISGNIELLAKHDLSGPQNRIVDRITRASKNMKQLIETLLWLGREVDLDLVKEDVNYPSLLNDVLDELTYFSESENVECQVTVLNTNVVSISSTALYIVVSNLMRNAFQHTPKGYANIQLIDGILSIENHLEIQATKASEKQGQGVGVNLVQRICARCDWHCEIIPLENGGMRAVLTLNTK